MAVLLASSKSTGAMRTRTRQRPPGREAEMEPAYSMASLSQL